MSFKSKQEKNNATGGFKEFLKKNATDLYKKHVTDVDESNFETRYTDWFNKRKNYANTTEVLPNRFAQYKTTTSELLREGAKLYEFFKSSGYTEQAKMLEDDLKGLDSINSLYSQWDSEDSYRTDFYDSKYRSQYEGYSATDISAAIEALEKQTKQSMPTYDAFKPLEEQKNFQAFNELQWLKKYQTSREVVDKMTASELLDYKESKQPEIEALKQEKKALEEKLGEYNSRKGVGVQKRKEIQDKIKDIDDKIASLDPTKHTLYYDDNGLPVTLGNMIRIKSTEEDFAKVQANPTAKNTYDSIVATDDDLKLLDKALQIVQFGYADYEAYTAEEAIQADEHRQIFDILKKKYGLDTTKELNAASIDIVDIQDQLKAKKDSLVKEFSKQGYDWDTFRHYFEWQEDREAYAAKKEESEKYATEHPIWATIENIALAPAQVFDYIGNLADGYRAKDADETSALGLVNFYDDDTINRSQFMTEKVSENIGNAVLEKTDSDVLSWLASTAYSGVTSSVQSAMTTTASTLMFGANAGTVIALGIMGSQAAASQFNASAKNGSTYGEAFLTSVAAGAAEAIFEKFSLDHFIKMGKGYDISSLSALIKSIGKSSGDTIVQGLIESSEELGTNLFTRMADDIINGDHSEYYSSINRYMEEGYSKTEAEKMADKDYLIGLLGDAFGGFIGGFSSGGVTNTFNSARAIGAYNSAVKNSGKKVLSTGGVDALKALANEVAGVTEGKASNRLKKLAEQVTAEKTRKNIKNLGKLSMEVDAARVAQNKDDITKALVEKGMTSKEAKAAADILMIASQQGELTKEQENILKNSTAMQEVLKDVVKNGSVSVRNSKHLYGRNGIRVDAEGNVNTEDLAEFVAKKADENSNAGISTKMSDNSFDVSEDGKNFDNKTGKILDSLQFVDDNGTVKVKVDDETTVDAGSVSYKNEGLAAVVSTFVDMGIDAASVQGIVEMFDGVTEKDAKAFVSAVKIAFVSGQMHFGKSDLSKLVGKFGITAKQAEDAYRLGEISAQAKIDKDQAAVDKQVAEAEATAERDEDGNIKAKHEKGEIIFEGEISEAKMKEKLRSVSIDGLKVLAELSPVRFHIFESTKDADGTYSFVMKNGKKMTASGWYAVGTRDIWIDINAGDNFEGTMLWTAAHEISHYIKAWNAKDWKVLADFLISEYERHNKPVKSMIEAEIRKIHNGQAADEKAAKAAGKEFKPMTEQEIYDAAFEEVVCEAMVQMFDDGTIVQSMAKLKQEKPNIWKKFKEAIKKILEKWGLVLDAYKDRSLHTREARAVAQMQDSFKKFQELYLKAFEGANYAASMVGDMTQTASTYKESSTIGARDLVDFADAKNTEGKQLFQYRAMEADEATYRDMLRKWGKMSDTQIDNLFTTIDRAMDIIKDNLEALDYAWESDINDRAFSPVKPNSDSLYQVSLDFSTLCRKRILQQTIQAQLQEALNQPLTREEGIAIRDALMALQEEGRHIEVACALCYVESARMKSPAQIQKFLNNREAVLKDFFAGKAGGSMKAKIKQAETDTREQLHKENPNGIKGKDGSMLDPRTAALKAMPKKYADAIRDAKKAAKESYQPTAEEQRLIEVAKGMTVSDFTSPEGLESLAKNYPALFDAYTSYVRNATKSKGIENDTWWRAGDSSKIGDVLIANMNRENGLRSQSWSDFQVIHILDYIAATIELATRNAKEQAYSKVPDYVELMGQTGVMINMSLIPTRKFNGSLEYDSIEGMAYKRALELREKYPATAGTICIGIDNEQIRMLLADITIDYVIPYHKSGMAAAIRKLMHIPTWSQYEEYQSESNLSDSEAKKHADKYGVKLLDKSDPNYQKHTSFSEWFDLEEAKQIAKMENTYPSNKVMQKKYGVMYGGYMAMQNAANNYLKLCAERGIAPKFSHEKADFTSEDNYWKLLIDRKMVNNATGEIIEQQAIQPIFDEGEILRILNDELERYPSVKADQDYATRKVTEKFLSGELKSGMSAEAIAKVMQKPVDNITKTNIVASAEGAVKTQERGATYGGIREVLAKQGLDELSKKLGSYFPLSASFDATMMADENPLTMETVKAGSVSRKSGESAYGAGKKAFRDSYGNQTSVHIDQMNIDATLYIDVARESINKALNKTDEQVLLDVIPNIKNILSNSILMSVERVAHTSGKGTALYGYRLYNLYWYQEGKKKTLHCLVCTVVQKTDKAEGYVFRDIENVTIDHGLPGKNTDMPEPVNDDTYTVAQLYRFVKGVNREDGGIKYSPDEKAKYGFAYTERNDGVKYQERNNIGYHAGDLGKAESLAQQGGGRDTGHFGTGTYFVGDKAEISYGTYGKRPIESVDFSKYNLFKPLIASNAEDLHEFLKGVNYYFDRPADLAKTEADIDNAIEQIEEILWDVDDSMDVDSFKKCLGIARSAIGNYSVGNVLQKYLDNVGLASDGRLYNNLDQELTDDEIASMIERKENVAYRLTEAMDDYYTRRSIRSYEEWNKSFDFVSHMLGITESKARKIVENVAAEIAKENYDYKASQTADSASTRFMKALGYEGVDVRGIKGFDNTAYGSVIYDLKGEDAERKASIGTAKYQERNTDSNRYLLASALESAAKNDIELKYLKEYKDSAAQIDALETHLQEVNAKIRDISFSKGTRDKEALRKLRDEATKTVNRISNYDKKLLRLEANDALKKLLGRERAKAYAAAKKVNQEVMREYREKTNERIDKIVGNYQESRKKAVEGRHKTEMRHKIKKVVSELNQLLLRGSKDKHVSIGMQKAVASALDVINMDTVNAEERVAKYDALIAKETDPVVIESLTASRDRIQKQGDSLAEKLATLKSAYASFKNSDDPDIANAHDEVVENCIEVVASKVGNTPIRNMTLEQLNEVYDMYKMILARVRNANKTFSLEHKEAISTLGNRVIGEVKRVGGERQLLPKATEQASKFLWNNLKPVYAMERIGSSTFSDVFRKVRAGEDTWAVDVVEAKSFSDEIQKKYNYKKWDFDKKYTFTSSTGLDFTLTLEQMLSLYAYSKREQAHEHLRIGGFVFDNAIETVKKKNSPIKYKVNIASAHQISPDTLGVIINSLHEDHKAFVDEMQKYLSEVMGAKGNEVSMALYDVKLFKEKFYFPLKSANQFMYQQNEVAGEVKVKNSGFSKETVTKANNPIILSNFMDVWANHVNDMSMYHAFVLPLEDFNRVFNYKTPRAEGMATVSVKETLQNAYGSHANEYLSQLLKDLNGGARSDPRESTAKFLLGKFKKASVFSSASVVIQQPSAVARALALINAKYFDYKPKFLNHKTLWEECKKYAPVAIIKEMGYFDTDMGMSTVDYIKGQKTLGDKVDDILSKAPALADELTWVHIWEAVKREVADKNKGITQNHEEYMKKAGERFTEVVTKTQVYDSVLARSANMRSKSGLMNMLTSFMAEPTTSINMLENGIRQSKRGYKGAAAKAFGAVTASVILNALLVSLVYAGRDDDEDETFLEKYISSFSTEVIEGINPITYLPILKDVWSLAQGYNIERSDMTLISKALDSLKQFGELIANSDTEDMTEEELKEHEDKIAEAIWSMVDNVTALFGVPVKNIRRDINACINVYKTATNGLGDNSSSLWDEVLESVKSATPVWGWFNDKAKSDKLYEAIVNGDDAYRKRIESTYDDEKAITNAKRKALKENDPRVKEAAQARFNGDSSEYQRIAYEIIHEGNFTFDDVIWAISSVYNSMKPKEESSSGSAAQKMFKIEDYFNAIASGDEADALVVKTAMVDADVAGGKTQEEAEEDFYGKVSSQCRDRYESGELSYSEAEDILVTYGGKTDEEASNKVRYWTFMEDYPDADISEEAITKYYTDVESSGIGIDVYVDYYERQRECKADLDENGKSISGSRKVKVMEVINSLPISNAQKDVLYYINGWAASTLYEAPWH